MLSGKMQNIRKFSPLIETPDSSEIAPCSCDSNVVSLVLIRGLELGAEKIKKIHFFLPDMLLGGTPTLTVFMSCMSFHHDVWMCGHIHVMYGAPYLWCVYIHVPTPLSPATLSSPPNFFCHSSLLCTPAELPSTTRFLFSRSTCQPAFD